VLEHEQLHASMLRVLFKKTHVREMFKIDKLRRWGSGDKAVHAI
jgi:hypothetical protein